MAIVDYTEKDLDLLARLMRSEAVGEGEKGMLMVGNVVVNRCIANCLGFQNTRDLRSVIYNNPGGFNGVNSNLFYSNSTARERSLAKRVLDGEYYYPATNALWFYSPSGNNACVSKWFNQNNTGRYKNHCFYAPEEGVCNELH